MSAKIITEVSDYKKRIAVGEDGVAAIKFYKREQGGTAGPFDIYGTYDENENLISRIGFFDYDSPQVIQEDNEYQLPYEKTGQLNIFDL